MCFGGRVRIWRTMDGALRGLMFGLWWLSGWADGCGRGSNRCSGVRWRCRHCGGSSCSAGSAGSACATPLLAPRAGALLPPKVTTSGYGHPQGVGIGAEDKLWCSSVVAPPWHLASRDTWARGGAPLERRAFWGGIAESRPMSSARCGATPGVFLRDRGAQRVVGLDGDGR